jgi:hypothetical protein
MVCMLWYYYCRSCCHNLRYRYKEKDTAKPPMFESIAVMLSTLNTSFPIPPSTFIEHESV